MDRSTGPAVSIQQLYLSYTGFAKSRVHALNGINLTVNVGSIFALLGPSGCGKTSLLRCIVGNLSFSKGIINVFGEIPGSRKINIPGSDVGYMPQELALDGTLTITETLNFYGCVHNIENQRLKSRIQLLLQLLDLSNGEQLVSQLSGGQKRRVSFAIALLHEPPLLVLDEPTVGVDPILRDSIWNHLREISLQSRVTIIITTHYIEEAIRADKNGFMRNGKILAQDSPEEFLHRCNSNTLEKVYVKLCLEDNQKDLTSQNTTNTNKRKIPLLARFNKAFKSPPDISKESIPRPNRKFHLDDFFPPQSCRRVKALVQKNFIKMKRSTLLTIFQFIVPIIQIGSFGLLVGRDFHSLSVAVCNEDKNLGAKYLQYLNNKTIHQIIVESPDEGLNLVLNGKAIAVLHIGSNFSDVITDKFLYKGKLAMEAGNIHIRYDTTNRYIVDFLQKTFFESALTFAKKHLGNLKKYPHLTINLIEVGKPIYGSVKPSPQEFIAPGVILTVIFLLACGMTSLLFISDKEGGILDRSYISGVTSLELLLGHLLTQFIVVIIQTAMVIVLSVYIFDVTIIGSISCIISLSLITGIAGMSFGFLVSTLCNDGTTCLVLTITIVFPNFLCCGSLWTVEVAAGFLKGLTPYLPQTLSIEALRWIMYRGRDLFWTPVWIGFIVISVWLLIFIILSIASLHLKR